MIINGKITQCNPMTTKDGGKLFETRFTDGSRPMSTRTSGEFVTYLSEETRKLFPSGDKVEGAEFTIQPRGMTHNKDGVLSFKGRIVPGIVQPADFEAAFDKQKATAAAAASAPARP